MEPLKHITNVDVKPRIVSVLVLLKHEHISFDEAVQMIVDIKTSQL